MLSDIYTFAQAQILKFTDWGSYSPGKEGALWSDSLISQRSRAAGCCQLIKVIHLILALTILVILGFLWLMIKYDQIISFPPFNKTLWMVPLSLCGWVAWNGGVPDDFQIHHGLLHVVDDAFMEIDMRSFIFHLWCFWDANSPCNQLLSPWFCFGNLKLQDISRHSRHVCT